MTLTEIQDIFSKSEVTHFGGNLFYNYYLLGNRNRGGGVVDPRNLESMVALLENYEFFEYTEQYVPVFKEKTNNVIEGT